MSEIIKSANKFYWLLGAGALAYIGITFTAPIKNNPYHLSSLQLHTLQLSIVIPVILIWAAAFYGAVRFSNYSKSIISSPDGKGLNQVSNGLLVLVVGLVTASLFNSLKPWFSAEQLPTFTIVSHYLALVFPIAAFVLFLKGSRKLADLVGGSKNKTVITVVLVALGLISVLYLKAFLGNPYANSTPDPIKHPSYYLPDAMLVSTIIIPNIIVWTLGALSVINLWTYKKKVKGTIYRKALRRLAQGLVAVTLFSIALQFLGTASGLFEGASLKAILIIVYIILIVYALAYLVIASGARKLSKIEEIAG